MFHLDVPIIFEGNNSDISRMGSDALEHYVGFYHFRLPYFASSILSPIFVLKCS